jgi:hypothetical protein
MNLACENLADVGLTLSLLGTGLESTEVLFERKFWLEDCAAERFLERAGEVLSPDSFSAKAGSYEVHTLYFDTASLDVYHRAQGWRNAKFRVRRYGTEEVVYLEYKTKQEGCTRKVRTQVPASEIGLLAGDAHTEEWAGSWFRRQLLSLGLRPVCHVTYKRLALEGAVEGRAVRLTLDRDLHAGIETALDIPKRPATPQPVMPGLSVVELKYADSMPESLDVLISAFALQRATMSKYRRAAHTLRLADGC